LYFSIDNGSGIFQYGANGKINGKIAAPSHTIKIQCVVRKPFAAINR
jgi:hypothetical protein